MMSKKHYLLYAVGVVLVVVFIGQVMLPHHWLYVYYGAVAFVVGSVALTEEWKTNKRFKAVIFVIAITVGGLLTTNGWNQLDNRAQKMALIKAIANEWTLNEGFLPCVNLPFDPNDKELGKVHHLYPTYKVSAFRSVLTSSLFTWDDQMDKRLLSWALLYETCTVNFNSELRDADWECSRTFMNQEKRREVYRKVNQSPLYKSYKNHHKAMGILLKKDYPWSLSKFLEEIEASKPLTVRTPEPNELNNKP